MNIFIDIDDKNEALLLNDNEISLKVRKSDNRKSI